MNEEIMAKFNKIYQKEFENYLLNNPKRIFYRTGQYTEFARLKLEPHEIKITLNPNLLENHIYMLIAYSETHTNYYGVQILMDFAEKCVVLGYIPG